MRGMCSIAGGCILSPIDHMYAGGLGDRGRMCDGGQSDEWGGFDVGKRGDVGERGEVSRVGTVNGAPAPVAKVCGVAGAEADVWVIGVVSGYERGSVFSGSVV